MSSDYWEDLIVGLSILRRHQTGPFPTHCEHDELWVMSDPTKYSGEELAELDKLGFFVSDDGFKSYQFGSA